MKHLDGVVLIGIPAGGYFLIRLKRAIKLVKVFNDQIEELKDKEVYFAVTVLWKILSSWIEGLEIY